MNKSEAHAVLGSSIDWEAEEIQDRIEEMVFNLKSYFLTNPTIVPLFRSRIAKLRMIQESILALEISIEARTDSDSGTSRTSDHLSLEELIRDYENVKAELKLKLSSRSNPQEIADVAEQLCDLELDYMDKFWNLSEDSGWPTESVKASEVPDYGDFIFELRKDSPLARQMILKERARIKVLLKKE